MLSSLTCLHRFTRLAASLPLALAILAAPASHAQAYPTATRDPIQAGIAFTFASPGTPSSGNSQSTVPYIEGFSAFGDIGVARRFGVEAAFHDTAILTPQDFGESTILIGPRYSIALEDRANIYLKALGGIGRFSYQSPTYIPLTNTYAVAAFGGGIEFRLSRHINLRPVDVEYQIWPGFPSGTLKPFVTSIGAAYRF